jgi:hypothetical protein
VVVVEVLIVAALVCMIGIAVVSMIAGLLAFVLWVLSLPFQLLGFLFKGVSWLLWFPVLLVLGSIMLVFGLTPMLPIVLAVMFVVWVFRQVSPRRAA